MGDAERVSAEGANPPPSGGFRVAGRIEPERESLGAVIDRWTLCCKANQRGRGSSAYASTLRAMVREMGVGNLSDLTAGRIRDHVNGKRSLGLWGPGSAKLALAVVRSFDRFCRTEGLPPLEGLELVKAPKAVPKAPARAATLEEARALCALAGTGGDGRRRGHHGLYLACLFLAGMRADEPERLEWGRHVFLEEPTPFLRFTPDINKNGLDEEVVIAPELAGLLRLHRDALREIARTTPDANSPNRRRAPRAVSPDAPGAHVFPWCPDRSIFRKLASRLKIPTIDRRGRTFSSRSARKWFSTTLTENGVPTLLVDLFLRHRAHVGQVYTDVSQASQLQTLTNLPRLFGVVQTDRPIEKSSQSHQSGVDKPPTNGQDIPVKLAHPIQTTPAPAPALASFTPSRACARAGFVSGVDPAPGLSIPQIGVNVAQTQSGFDRAALADFLDAAARLIRGGAA